MKRYQSHLAALFAAVALAGCGGGDDSPAPAPAPAPIPVPAPPPPPPADPLAAVPSTAMQSVAGLVAYLQSLTLLLTELREPIDTSAITSLPTSDDSEPLPVN